MSPVRLATISEFCTTGTGGTPLRERFERYYEGGTIPWVKSGELREETIYDTEEHLTDLALQESSIRKVPAGALLLAMYGATVGRLATLGVEATTNQAICHIIPDPLHADVRYLFNALRSQVASIVGKGVGGAQPNISQGIVRSIRVLLPPLPEQRRIAEILDKADALRARRRAAIAQLDTLTQSIFLDMFGEPEEILRRWPVKRLSELLDFLTSGSRGWAAHYAASGALFLRIQNVRRDELVLQDVAYVNAPDTAEAKRTKVQSGDVLLSITADLGRTAVVPEGLGQAHINQHLSILRTSKIVPRFLSAYLASPAGQRQVLGRNRQAVKAGLNFDDIKSLQVPVPPQETQHRFSRALAAVGELRNSHTRSLATLESMFAAVQHAAFNGRI